MYHVLATTPYFSQIIDVAVSEDFQSATAAARELAGNNPLFCVGLYRGGRHSGRTVAGYLYDATDERFVAIPTSKFPACQDPKTVILNRLKPKQRAINLRRFVPGPNAFSTPPGTTGALNMTA